MFATNSVTTLRRVVMSGRLQHVAHNAEISRLLGISVLPCLVHLSCCQSVVDAGPLNGLSLVYMYLFSENANSSYLQII